MKIYVLVGVIPIPQKGRRKQKEWHEVIGVFSTMKLAMAEGERRKRLKDDDEGTPLSVFWIEDLILNKPLDSHGSPLLSFKITL